MQVSLFQRPKNSRRSTYIKGGRAVEESNGWRNRKLKTNGNMDFTRSSRWLKTIGCKWVFIRKRDNTGNIVQWKVRLVAQGFSQKPGTDYDNDGTFAPVMQFKTLQTILAHGTVDKLHLRQFDVKGAYLNGYLNKTIYMQQLPGYEDWSGKVCLLKRSLYGLKKARNVWNQKLKDRKSVV